MIVKINNKQPDKDIINHAVRVLKRGGVLVIPTETAYGLAADATNARGVKKIYKIKGRSFKKFLPLIAESHYKMREFFKVGAKEKRLLTDYQGLSVVLSPKNKKIKASAPNIYLMSGQQTCVVRVSTNKVAKLIAKKLGRPITATSANKAGGGNCYTVREVLKQIGPDQVDLILDGGKLAFKKPSTIVKVINGGIEILRQGEIRIKNFKL